MRKSWAALSFPVRPIFIQMRAALTLRKGGGDRVDRAKCFFHFLRKALSLPYSLNLSPEGQKGQEGQMMGTDCFGCSRLDKWKRWGVAICCEAFPSGIPEEILTGQVSHTTPYPGDHGLLFDPCSLNIS